VDSSLIVKLRVLHKVEDVVHSDVREVTTYGLRRKRSPEVFEPDVVGFEQLLNSLNLEDVLLNALQPPVFLVK
jgi:hypothetical protein